MANDDAISVTRRAGGQRKSGGRAIVFWTVAILAGGSAAMLVKYYVENSAQPAAASVTKVCVAAMDLPIATTIRAEQIKLVDWPKSGQPANVSHDPKELIDRVLVGKMFEGEPILTTKLASKDAGRGLAALIPPSMRAVAVRVDDVVGVAGFVHPEDRVDVIVTMKPVKPSDAEPTSKLILQNVKVLAVGKELETKDANRAEAMPVTVATLLVSPEDSERLALAGNQGKLLLTLRGWTDSEQVETAGSIPSVLLSGVALGPQPIAPAPVMHSSRTRRDEKPEPQIIAPVVLPPPPKKEVVEILRGDRFEERNFDAKEKK